MLLLMGAILTAIILERSLGRAKDVRVEQTVGRMESAAESGVQHALQHMLSNKSQQGIALPRDLQVDGVAVQVSAQFSDGLVGLRTRNKEYIERVSTVALGGRGVQVAQSLLGPSLGTVSSYAGLAKVLGITQDELACLLPYVSLYIDNELPLPSHAPQEVLRLLRPDNRSLNSVVQGNINSLAGSVVRIRTRASIEGHSSRVLLAEVLVTGRLDNPFLVLDWLWLPANSKAAGSSEKCASGW